MGGANEKQTKFMHIDKSFRIVFDSGHYTELDPISFQFIIDVARPGCSFEAALQKTKNDLVGNIFANELGIHLDYENEISEMMLRHIDEIVTDHYGQQQPNILIQNSDSHSSFKSKSSSKSIKTNGSIKSRQMDIMSGGMIH